MLSTLNLFCLTQCPQNGCLYERCSQCEASSLKQNAPEMDAFQQRLLNSQRETYFLLNLFCLTQCPQNGCLYERCSQCEACSSKAKTPRNGCLSAKTFEFSGPQGETYFLLKPDAPETNAFHVKDVVNIEPFLFDTMPFFTFADDTPQHLKQPDRSLHPASASIANPR